MDTMNTLAAEFSSVINADPWIMQVFLVVFFTLVLAFVQKRICRRLQTQLERSPLFWDNTLLEALTKPLTLFIWIVGLAFAMQIIYAETGAVIFEAVEPIRDVAVIGTMTWFMVRFITCAANKIISKREANGEPYDRTTVDAVTKLLRISIIITAALVALQTLGFSVSGVLAFGGIGGIAIGFAARDLLANFFGGLMVYMDRPFAIGDWVRSPDRDIEGNVEEIGWRLTRIRTFDKRPLYVPNAVFNQISLENPSRMTNRRIREIVGVRYDDAGKVGVIVDDIKNMIRNHPEIDTNHTLIVNFDSFAPSSLDILVYTFTKTRNWVEFHEIKQDVLLKIIDIIESHGAECAFPTSTVHVPDGLRLQQLEMAADESGSSN